jgi:hypothetical protein
MALPEYKDHIYEYQCFTFIENYTDSNEIGSN